MNGKSVQDTVRKTVKIKFVGFNWPGFTPEENIVYRILEKYYDVVITDDPDYIICSIFGEEYEYCKYPQVRIMCIGEDYVPDFNLIDYSISRFPIDYFDRNFYLIGCADNYKGQRWYDLETKDRNYDKSFLEKKDIFANFIASHESDQNMRGDFFKELCKYKKVLSFGSYLNNTDGMTVNFQDDSKTEIQRRSKFSLCFEALKHEGFITEKISDAFYADSIPVYFGSSNITDIFNEKAFICCKSREDFQNTIDRIIELDQNDEKYMEMLRQPIFVRPDYPSYTQRKLEEFVLNIFDQPLDQAYRRSTVFWGKTFNDYILETKRRAYGGDDIFSKARRKISYMMEKSKAK